MATRLKIILLIETSREYGRGLLRGIARYSHLHGPWAFYREPTGLERTLPHLKSWHADGMIIRETKRIGVKEIRSMGLPTVVSPDFKGPIAGLYCLVADNLRIGEMAAEYLLNRGFRHLGYCGYENVYWSQDRGRGFRTRVTQAGLEAHVYTQPLLNAKLSWQKEQTMIARWLKLLPKPVAIMACNDDRSHQVTEACKIAGLHVPEQVAILGVDNDGFVCDLSDPPLSSIVLNTEKAGYEAASLLHELITARKTDSKNVIVHPLHIVTRQSTDILAVEDREVAEAIRFIREHCREVIQVSDVVDAVALSRRALEQRFRRVIHRSVLQEIRRVRIEQITKMLAETNLSISQIASTLGYTGVENIGRYFRREKGMSPQAYRKRFIYE